MLNLYLISVATKTTILLAAGLLLIRWSRRQGTATRYLICLVALMSAAVVPLLALWSPDWSYFITIPAKFGAGSGGHRVKHDFTDWPTLLSAIWAVGTLIFAVRSAGGWFVLQRARQTSSRFMRGEAAEVRIGNVSMPLTCGVLRPVIILPRNARQWSRARLRIVLLHESAHVRRRDCLAKSASLTSRTLLWWNPLAWVMTARLDEEQERACDEAVLSAGVAPEDYARTLLNTARECPNSLLLGCAMSSSVLRARLEYLLSWRPEMACATRRTALAIPLLLALFTDVGCAVKRTGTAAQIPAGLSQVSIHAAQSRPHK